jgi:hypothetical protein
MRSLATSWLWLSCVLVLGCAAPETPAQAQERGGGGDRPTTARSDDEAEEIVRFRAEILERGKDEAFTLEGVALFVPEVSLFGGDSGEESEVLEVRKGATRLEVPLERLAVLEISEPDPDADRIEVTIRLRADEGAEEPAPLTGTIKANLELRGLYQGLKAVIKLREAKQVKLTVQE